MNYKTAHYGWLPDLPDHRDRLYSAPMEMVAALPSKVDLRAQCPPVYDQWQLSSCTAKAIAAAIDFDQLKRKFSILRFHAFSLITTNAPSSIQLIRTAARRSPRPATHRCPNPPSQSLAAMRSSSLVTMIPNNGSSFQSTSFNKNWK